MTGHTFGDIVCDGYGKYHWPCSCGIEATGYNLLDVDAGRVVHLRGVEMDAELLIGETTDYPGDTGPGGAA